MAEVKHKAIKHPERWRGQPAEKYKTYQRKKKKKF